MEANQWRKIALFWPTLAGGGVERNGLRVARELSERGYSVDIVVANARGELADEVPPGVSLVNLRSPLGKGKLLFSLLPLVRYLREHPPDVFMSSMTEANLIAILARIAAGSRCWLVVSEHSTLSIRIKRSIRKRVLPFLVRQLYPLADRIHAVSHGVADDLAMAARISREEIRVVYNPVVTSDLFFKAEEPLDHPWFATGQPPVVLGIGRLTVAKDFCVLIHAFALVRKECQARLMILGEGEERTKLEVMVRELGLQQDVAMPGFIDNPYKYIKRAGVFVLSSRWEGLPTVLIEAEALGVPLVSTDCPNGPSEILDKGRYGRLVPVGDHRLLASAIVDVLRDANVVTEQARQARMRRAMEFSVERIINRYQELLFPTGVIKGERLHVPDN